ncbi:hypothetical protein G7047_29295 [Diaphorobacter sp. HDW4A]|nr:hypothetical protein [Diaphorobacter caeni]MBF5003358.1 hypothetical protein [Diaphorobacter caeni]QIL80826.1 hypothetical protein G7047_13610 [Diaphorobacter sp. HDW4A]QIL83577.1 hypothetical protein G7047_29295 [Diaphorobacter sp. HDW4A]
MSKEMIRDIAVESAKASPPVAVVTTSVAQGWSINATVGTLTIVYLLLQIGWLLYRWRKAAQGTPVKGE